MLVVGGGPAGMKAACMAAERGHRVTLVEKDTRLGGQLLLNRQIPGREEMATLATDLAGNLKARGVAVLTGQAVDRALVEGLGPDTIVVATGARPALPEIPGSREAHVCSAWDVLAGKAGVGRRAVIVGGNAVGLETALFLAHQGTLPPEVLRFLVANRAEDLATLEHMLNQGIREVTVLEMTERAGQDIGGSTRWSVLAELRRLGAKIITGARAVEIKKDGVCFAKAGAEDFLPADSLILATGSLPENSLAQEIRDLAPEIHTIGDAKEPRNALEAIKEGFFTGLSI